MNGYQDWQCFRAKGKRFIALVNRDGTVNIYGPGGASYGGWYSRESFWSEYRKRGEALALARV